MFKPNIILLYLTLRFDFIKFIHRYEYPWKYQKLFEFQKNRVTVAHCYVTWLRNWRSEFEFRQGREFNLRNWLGHFLFWCWCSLGGHLFDHLLWYIFQSMSTYILQITFHIYYLHSLHNSVESSFLFRGLYTVFFPIYTLYSRLLFIQSDCVEPISTSCQIRSTVGSF